MKPFRLLLVGVLFICGCKQNQNNNALFALQEGTGIEFANTIQNTKDFNIFSYRNFYNGGGAAIGDINNDGLADVFFSANMGSNKLYLNKGNFKFEDISDKAGIAQEGKWNTGVVMVDINNDGWLDLYVCNAGIDKWKNNDGNALFINNKNGTFTERAKEYGLDNKGYSTHAAFFDYDLDGDLDCYILNNSFIPVNTLNYSNKRDLRAKDWPVADFLKGGGSYLMRNDNGHYTDISEEAGIYGSLISFGLGVTVGDVNGDQYPDIYVSNDFFERDYLYINQRNGKFKEELQDWMQHISMSSMGADLADINNDGYPDLFVTDMLPDDDYRLKTTTSFENIDVFRLKEKQGFYRQYMQNTLQVNNKSGKFVETAFFSGVAASDWSWGGLIFDADNDGLPDIYVCNGIYHDVTNQDFIDFFANDVIQKMVLTGEKEQVNEIINKMPSVPIANKIFRNLGNLRFADSAATWGITQKSFSNGAAYGDLDNDGDLDLVVNNINEKAFVYKNHSRERNGNHYIAINLEGKDNNRFALGSKVNIYQAGQVISRDLMPSKGFQSSVDYKIIAGTGTQPVDSVVVYWPDRSVSKLVRPGIDTLHIIKQSAATGNFAGDRTAGETLLVLQDTTFQKHQEDDFIDFYDERNMIMMVSREGPRAAVADVNKDGTEDIYIGGANGQAGALYLQKGNRFVKNSQAAFMDSGFETTASVFFDCDGDGDMDLLLGAGGNNHAPRARQLQHRLYINDGRGGFSLRLNALPENEPNVAVILPHDYDGDGDTDLFIGGRSLPYSYGAPPRSYLLENDGKGNFKDVTAEKAKPLERPGMITGAVWEDVYGDAKKELIVTGDWMQPRIFTNTSNRFEEIKTGLDSLLGWWQTVQAADLDGDGDKDLVLGNIGQNFYLRPHATHPVKLWLNDFDRNEGIEKVYTRTIDGKDMPVFLKRDLTDQVVLLKKQNLKYDQFARKSIQELFNDDLIKSSVVKEFNYAASCIAWNEGNGKFSVQALPVFTQLSSINAIVCTDINNDGLVDIVAAGNRFDLLPQFGRLDASYGHLLINKGQRRFEELNAAQSGLLISGQVRDIQLLHSAKDKFLLFLQNNERPVLYKVKGKPAKQDAR
jgi:enediyne biosynthesis protein E4